MGELNIDNEKKISLSKEDKNKQEIREALSFLLSTVLFLFFMYVCFHLCAYWVILTSDVYPDFWQRVEELKNTEVVFVSGMICIVGTYLLVVPVALFISLKLATYITKKILNMLIKE